MGQPLWKLAGFPGANVLLIPFMLIPFNVQRATTFDMLGLIHVGLGKDFS